MSKNDGSDQGKDKEKEDPNCTAEEKEIQNKLFDIVQKRYEFELQRSKDLDSKAGNLIGYVGVITALILGLGTFGLLGNLTKLEYFILYFLGVSALATSIGFALFGAKVTYFQFRPDYDLVFDHLFDPSNRIRNYCDFIKENTFNLTTAFTENSETNNSKANRILISWFFFIAGIVLLLSYAIIFVWQNEIAPGQETATVSVLDNKTIRELISGADVNIVPNHTFNVNSPISPNTDLPWMEIQYQWLKPNLTVYVIADSRSLQREYEDIAGGAINEWIGFLKKQSNNSSSWEIDVRYIDEDNLVVYRTNPPDIIISLFDDPDKKRCTEYYGEAEQFRDDAHPQYAEIYTTCGNERLSNASIYNTVLHEFAHLLGLGHAHTEYGDLLCSVDKDRKRTCPTLPDDNTRPSELDVESLLSIYGSDGFGGYNRVLINKPYYVLTK